MQPDRYSMPGLPSHKTIRHSTLWNACPSTYCGLYLLSPDLAAYPNSYFGSPSHLICYSPGGLAFASRRTCISCTATAGYCSHSLACFLLNYRNIGFDSIWILLVKLIWVFWFAWIIASLGTLLLPLEWITCLFQLPSPCIFGKNNTNLLRIPL